MKWFKFYGQDYISDPKMLSLTACERSCWITLLSYSSINDTGTVTFLSEEQLMTQAGISPIQDDWETTKGILEKFQKLGLITIDNETITVTNWGKRQETNLTSYQRVKRYREKKRNDNAMITLEENRIEENRIDMTKTVSLKYEDSFNLFWKEYPKKIGKSEASRAWKKLRPSKELSERIINSVSAHKEHKDWKREDGRFIPNPATYLNQGRYDDELMTTTITSKYAKYAS